MLRHLIAALAMCPFFVSGADLTPWLTTDFEPQIKGSALLQIYPKINSTRKTIHRTGHDQFYNLGLEFSAFDYSAEVETTVAHTHRQNYAFDNIRLTGRVRWLNDIAGVDPVSLTTGITLIQAFKHSLFDISSFHHGKFESEFHVAVGKEYSVEEFWTSRWWGVFALGLADHGSPWIRTELAWEKNWCDVNQLRLFANTLWGLGGKGLGPVHDFHGYGPIRHQSIDLGVRLSHTFPFSAVLSVEYAYRVYAQNFPERANFVFLQFIYPFGL